MNEKHLATLRPQSHGSLKKITILGDSIPKCLYLHNGKICRIEYSAVQTLTERLNLSIENLSIFGLTLKKCYEKGIFDRWLQDHKFTGDLLILSLGGNDCDYNWNAVEKNPFAEHYPNTPIPEFERLLHTIIRQAKAVKIKPIFTSLPPIDSQRYFENIISKRADPAQILKFFHGDITNISRHQECYNNAIQKVALSSGCQFLDYRSTLLLKTDYLSYLSDDGIHPNQKGHDAIAAFIYQKYSHYADRYALSAP